MKLKARATFICLKCHARFKAFEEKSIPIVCCNRANRTNCDGEKQQSEGHDHRFHTMTYGFETPICINVICQNSRHTNPE